MDKPHYTIRFTEEERAEIKARAEAHRAEYEAKRAERKAKK